MTEFKRFNVYHRILHIAVVISFIGLVMTGMPLRYADAPWAAWLMKLLGGYRGAGLIHRICAVITFGYFVGHIIYVLYFIAIIKKFKFNPFGPDSMVPWIKDMKDIYHSFKWFLGRGPQPQFDRWTYWEKFDYWAVFWGVGMIGVSGLFLWFPEFFGRFFPGWTFNIALIIHSDEALLAAGFIFTIHFFNSHLRPDKFPMDRVIFTGRLSIHELQHERPLEYQRLLEEKRLEDYKIGPQSLWARIAGVLFGSIAVLIGLILLVLILLGQFYY
jgi:thiosulfate reductase cytochrome b subunit